MIYFSNFDGGSSGGLSATRYRINISAVQSPGNWVSIQEIEMAATVGGADLCTGGTPTVSAFDGASTADKAFDDNTGTAWSSGSGTMPHWVEYQFASAVTVAEVRIRCNAIGDAPANFTIEYHDGSTWKVLKTVVGAGWGGTGQTRSFPIGGKSYQQWRLQGITTQGGTSWVQISELEFRATSGGADQCTGGFARANSLSHNNAFDNNTGTAYSSGTGVNADQWIEYHLPNSTEIVEISNRNTATPNDSWTAFKVQVHDSDNLIDVWTVSSTGAWLANETKIFTNASAGSVSFSVSPTVSTDNGLFAEGDTATVSYDHNGLTTTIRWLRNGVAIAGATSASYTYQAADVGTTVEAEVTGHRISHSTTLTSAGDDIVTPTYSTDTRVTDTGDQRVADTGDVRVTLNRLT